VINKFISVSVFIWDIYFKYLGNQGELENETTKMFLLMQGYLLKEKLGKPLFCFKAKGI